MIHSTKPAECELCIDSVQIMIDWRRQKPFERFMRDRSGSAVRFVTKLLNIIRSLRSQRIRTPTPSVNENKRRNNVRTTSERSAIARKASKVLQLRFTGSSHALIIRVTTTDSTDRQKLLICHGRELGLAFIRRNAMVSGSKPWDNAQRLIWQSNRLNS